MTTHTQKVAHTPGPWKILHTPTRKETFWAITTSNEAPVQAVICLVDGKSKAHLENPEMATANARLISAAPDLLAVCKTIAAETSAGLRWSANNINALQLAIAKAQGTP